MNLYALQPSAIRMAKFLRPVFCAVYAIGRWRFLALTKRLNRSEPKVAAVYLRGSMVEGDFEPALSDLNWVLVLENLHGDLEMETVKELWAHFEHLKRIFPFLSEPRVMNVSDFTNWVQQPLQGLREVPHWRLEWGRELRPKEFPEPAPEDIFQSLLQEWWLICHALVKLEWFTLTESADPSVRIRLRNAAKALADFRRILRPETSRKEALGELSYLLGAHGPLPENSVVWNQFASAALENLRLLEQTAVEVPLHAFLVPHRNEPEEVPEDLPLRELYAEKMVFTASLQRALVSHWDSHVWLEFASVPDLDCWNEVLLQSRDTGFSFDRRGTTIFLGPRTAKMLSQGYLATLPFHDWGSHTEVRLDDEVGLSTTQLVPCPSHLSAPMMFRAMHELGLEVRSRPKNDSRHFRERILGLALALRASAAGSGGSTDDFLRDFERIQPLRARVVREKIGPITIQEEDDKLWGRLGQLRECLGQIDSERGKSLASQFEKMRIAPQHSPGSLWVELSPFLRAETNALRDRVSRERPQLRL